MNPHPPLPKFYVDIYITLSVCLRVIAGDITTFTPNSHSISDVERQLFTKMLLTAAGTATSST